MIGRISSAIVFFTKPTISVHAWRMPQLNAMIEPCSVGSSHVKFCTKCKVLVLTLKASQSTYILVATRAMMALDCYHAQNTAPHDNFLILLTVKTSFMKQQENKLRGIYCFQLHFKRRGGGGETNK